jgi:phage shock protein A
MTLRSRLALMLNVQTSAALDQVEDPREVLDYAYSQQQAHLHTVKRGRLEVAAARRHLEREAERFATRAEHLREQAKRAVRMGHEELARTALERRQAALSALRGLERQRAELAREEERLAIADQHLSQRVEQFRLHRTVLGARYAAAAAQVAAGEAIGGLVGDQSTELSLAVERSEERVEQLSARALAIDELTSRGALLVSSAEDDVERELEALDTGEAVEAELAALRQELAQGEPGQAGEGGGA